MPKIEVTKEQRAAGVLGIETNEPDPDMVREREADEMRDLVKYDMKRLMVEKMAESLLQSTGFDPAVEANKLFPK